MQVLADDKWPGAILPTGDVAMLTTLAAKSGVTEDFPRLAYSVGEVAQMLGVCPKTVRRLIDRGLIRASRKLRHLMIPRTEVERFLRETLPP